MKHKRAAEKYRGRKRRSERKFGAMKVGISVLPALAAIFIGGFARCNGQQQPDQLLQTDEQQLGGPDEDGGVGERNVTDKGSLGKNLV